MALWALTACGDSDEQPPNGGVGGTGAATSGGGAGQAGAGGTGAGGSAGAGGAGAGGATGGSGGVGGSGGSGGAPLLPGSIVTAAPYGCACDGTTNDSNCIDAALADHSNWKNRTLEFPQDATCIAVSLDLKDAEGTASDNYVLRGNGATIKAPDGHPVVSGNWLLRIDGSSFITVHDLDFDGNRDTRQPDETVAHNVIIRSSQDVLLEDVDSNDAVTDGLYVGAEVQSDSSTFPVRITVKNPIMRRAYRNNISIINCDTCVILGDGNGDQSSCQLTDANGTLPEAGIDFEPNSISAVPGIVNSRIEGCYIARNEGSCVMLTGVGSPIDTIVRGNTLEDCRSGEATCGSGVMMGQKGALVEDNVFKNFTLASSCRSVIDFGANGANKDTSAIVRNNQFNKIQGLSSSNRILYIHSNNFGGHAFKNNTLTDIGVGASGDWCNQGGTTNPNDISGNTVDGQLQSPNPGCP